MDRLGLSPSDLHTFHKALTWTYERRIHVQVLDLNMNTLRWLTPNILDGQVTYDATGSQPTTRILTMSILDPSQALAFEPDSPGPALWRNRLLRVVYAVRVPALNRWVDVPVFTGPVFDFSRQGALVNITAHGMERLALGNAWNPKKYPAKSKRTDAIKSILGRVGEDCHAVPDLPYKLPHDFHVMKMQKPWERAQHLAKSMNRYLFYDGHGTLHLRRHNDRPVFTFDDELLTPPQFQRSKDPIVNTVEVLGAKPKGKKTRVRAVATATGWLSPTALGRGSTALRLAEQIQNDHLRSHSEAQAVADRRLRQHFQQRVAISFDALPVPHLEERDRVAVTSTGVGSANLRMNQWTLPLGGGDGSAPPMTVGSVRLTSRQAAGVRRGS